MKKALFHVLAGAGLALAAACSLAQNAAYPARPIRMIIPFQAGGLNDGAGRAINQSLSALWNQPIVIENRVGANGNIGMEACARSAPDGYTICFPTGVVMSLNPFAYSKLPFEPLELVPVIHVGTLDQVITVSTTVPVKTVRELVEYGKANPGKLSWASLGMGSTAHLYMEWLQAKTGAVFTHVPYKTSAQLLQEVVSGEVHISTNVPSTVAPQVKSGKLRALALVTGPKGSPYLPGVPTLASQGYDLDFRNWLALYFPRGTPGEFARRWNSEVNKLLADPAFVERYLTPISVSATGGTPEDLAAFLKSNRETAAELARIAQLRFD
jgi:tripartite-type tricarboxylate transporter receptor subunit TctC